MRHRDGMDLGVGESGFTEGALEHPGTAEAERAGLPRNGWWKLRAPPDDGSGHGAPVVAIGRGKDGDGDPAARPQDTAPLAQRRHGVRHVHQAETAKDGIEGSVREIQLLAIHGSRLDLPQSALAGYLERELDDAFRAGLFNRRYFFTLAERELERSQRYGHPLAQIVPTSRLVSQITGYPVQPNKAIVGANAFAHESGIHQDGVLKHRETYEIMRAEDVGWGANKLVLGKLSGRNAFRARLQELGIEIESEEHLNQAFARFKELADRKSEIFDEDLTALMRDEAVTPAPEQYRLVSTRFHSETGETPVAEITLSIGGAEKHARANGSGPVDAAFKAIETVATTGSELLLYSVNAITSGTDAQGEVTVRLSRDGRVMDGQGADTDIIVASAKAYLNALNKLHVGAERLNPQV